MNIIQGKEGTTAVNLLEFSNRRAWESFLVRYEHQRQYNRHEREGIERQIQRTYQDTSWWGKPKPRSAEDILRHDRFIHFDTYNILKLEANKALRQAEKLGAVNQVPKKQLTFNDLGIGVFSFSRAALGLRSVENTWPLASEYVKLQIELAGHSGAAIDVPQRFVSDIRKSFAWFPPKEAATESVKLYIICGGNANITGEQMIYSGIAPVLIADYLVEAGLNVEVNAIINGMTAGVNCGMLFRLKPYDGELNVNDCLLASSDPRFFRSKGFFSVIAAYDYFGRDVPPGLGTGSTHAVMRPFLEAQNRDEAIPILLDRAYNKEAVLKEINRVLETVKNRRQYAGQALD